MKNDRDWMRQKLVKINDNTACICTIYQHNLGFRVYIALPVLLKGLLSKFA